jgi:peptidoglycan hydrolase-like protein with peptidoglycan-binding domain
MSRSASRSNARGNPARASARTATLDDFAQPRGLRSAGDWPYRVAKAALGNPIRSGAVLLSVGAALAIATNALSNQHRRHPAPLFETRPFAAPEPAAARTTATTPYRVAVTPAAAPVPPPLPMRTQEIAVPAPKAKPSANPATLVRDLQQALKDRGLYPGTVDGVSGPATQEAIRAFERQLNQPVTGEPSDRLLAFARDRSATAAARPAGAVPAPAPAAAPAAGPVPPAPIIGRPEPLAPGGDEKLQRVQRALVIEGYGPLRADGKLDERTQDAIRRYELDHGWAVTGKPSDRLALDIMVQATR